MNGLLKRQYERLTRVRDFFVKHSQLFPTNSSAQRAFATITVEVERLDALNLTERGASRAARAARILECRTRLVDTLVRAKNTARVLVKTIPELSTQVELPAGRERPAAAERHAAVHRGHRALRGAVRRARDHDGRTAAARRGPREHAHRA